MHVTAPHDLDRAMKVALRLLSVRARTNAELDRALHAREVEDGVRLLVLERLRTLGYVDDERFASARATALLLRGRLAPGVAQQRLEAHGLTEQQAKRALASAQEELGLTPLEVARRLLQKRSLDLANLSPSQRGSAARSLTRRGFEPEVIETLLGVDALDPMGQDD